MTTETKDAMGDRMKGYEKVETGRRIMAGLPIIVRLDGRGFSRFTKGMEKPFDERMVDAMSETAKTLVEKTHADLGYVQSDEITLVFMPKDRTEDYFFGGKVHKITSVLAGLCSTAFYRALESACKAKIQVYADRDDFKACEQVSTEMAVYLSRLPHFDARAFQVPLAYEAANAVLWRVKDAERNAVQMVAQSLFSHKQLQRLSTRQLRVKIADANFDFEALPRGVRSGRFFAPFEDLRPIPQEALDKMRVDERPADGLMRRSRVEEYHPEGPIDYRWIANILAIPVEAA